MSRFTGTASPRPLRVLCLDGGGVRGLSSLVILKRLMHLIDPNLPKPCDCFDLIAGTSTGGLIAIMLGRLGMSIDACIVEYMKLAKKVFKPRKRTYLGGSNLWKVIGHSTFNAKYLEDAIKEILKTASLSEDAMLMDESSRCKVFVCTINRNTQVELLRSYVANKEDNIKCTIVQAARATSAAPLLFDPVEIGGSEFSDGGLRYNNPIKLVHQELRQEFTDLPGGCIVSIGTGIPRAQRLGKTLVRLAKSCADIALDVKTAHQEFKLNECSAGGPFQGKYFRFNVDQGLQDIKLHEWNKMEAVEHNTRHYLHLEQLELDKCIECLVQCDQVEEKVEEEKSSIEEKPVDVNPPRKGLRKRLASRLKRAWKKVSRTGKSSA